MVPDELALQLDQLDVEVVEFADDFRTVVVGEERELLSEIDFGDCIFGASLDIRISPELAGVS